MQGFQLFVFVVCCRVAFEFQHNVCGRSIYAQGTVDAVLFLSKKVSNYLVTWFLLWCSLVTPFFALVRPRLYIGFSWSKLKVEQFWLV